MTAVLSIYINGERRLSCPYLLDDYARVGAVLDSVWLRLRAAGRVAVIAEGPDRVAHIILRSSERAAA